MIQPQDWEKQEIKHLQISCIFPFIQHVHLILILYHTLKNPKYNFTLVLSYFSVLEPQQSD